MPAAVAARACCRVDFAGGTLDIWPLGLLHRGARTVNVAIAIETGVRLAPRAVGYRVVLDDDRLDFDGLEALATDERTALFGLIAEHYELPPCEIRPTSDSPRGGGLGASSALAIALIAAAERLLGVESTAEHRAAVARDVEARLMELPTGRQDHYPPLLGGALEVVPGPGGDAVRRLAVDLEALGESLIVAFTGKSHFSAGHNWRVVRRRLDGDPRSRRLFDGIAAVAAEAAPTLESGDWQRLGGLMSREWGFRRELAEGVSTPRVERLLTAAIEAGAWGGKACGAGGGGSVAILCPPERRSTVETALVGAGARILVAPPTAAPVAVEAGRDARD